MTSGTAVQDQTRTALAAGPEPHPIRGPHRLSVPAAVAGLMVVAYTLLLAAWVVGTPPGAAGTSLPITSRRSPPAAEASRAGPAAR